MNPIVIASLEMIFSTMIWGFGFVATRWALESVDTVTLSVFRFFVAFLIGLVILLIKRDAKNLVSFQNLKLSAGPGLLLGFMLVTQTWGLELTSVTNSGFITTLYVVFVPLIERLFLRKPVTPATILWVILALAGTALMVNLRSFSEINMGDLLTLICAILGAGQIVWVSELRAKIKSSFAFNVYQSFWGAVAAIVSWPFYQNLYLKSFGPKAIWGVISVTLGSTLIAFALQIKAQKVLPATTASLFFLFESPFATLFAILFLGEVAGLTQLAGAALILASCLGSVLTLRKSFS